MMFGRIALRAFAKAHPPRADNVPASADALARHKGDVPAALLELWRKHGFGFYGDRQICLIEPDAWQATLDRWIVSPPDAVRRVPIALTPFGAIVYYRKLTAADEDVATLDPVTRKVDVVSWSLTEFFNTVLCDPASLDALAPSHLLDAGRREAGALKRGEVYHVDPVLLTMQMLKIVRTDALALHKKLRDAVDHEQAAPSPPPESLLAALPPEHRAAFADAGGDGEGVAGLYLSRYIDWRRLVMLGEDGGYRLLFWKNDHKTGAPSGVRLYAGRYKVFRTPEGDRVVRLGLELTADSLGSDIRDDKLFVMTSGGETWLLQAGALADIATAIGGRGRMGSSERYFRRARLADPIPGDPSDGRDAPPFDDLPAALRALVHRAPLRATIVAVGASDDPEDTTVMVKVDLGTKDGLRMNMPLMSPAGGPRALRGWVWEMDADSCGVGVRVARDDAGAIVGGPEIGDVLVTRAE